MVYRGGYTTNMKSRRHKPVVKRFWLRAAEHSIVALDADCDPEIGDGDRLLQNATEFRRATAEWAAPRFVALWNGLPGVAPVRKFTDRATATKRIWAAIQELVPNAIPAPDPTQSHGAEVKARGGTKKEQVLALLSRPNGVTIAEVVAALGWQSHSVRGFLSTLRKKGLKIHSVRRATGLRFYSTLDPEANQGAM